MIELAMAALIETADYQEEGVRIAMAYHCVQHEIEGRGVQSAIENARERFVGLGYSRREIDQTLDGVVQAMEASGEPQGDEQFCRDMFELMYPDE